MAVITHLSDAFVLLMTAEITGLDISALRQILTRKQLRTKHAVIA